MPFVAVMLFAFPLIFLALLLACVAGLIILWIRVLRMPKAAGPSCGKCGYLVQGMSTFQCPECGSDLRQVGIDTAKQRGTLRPWAFALGWSLLYPLPALLVVGILIAIGPMVFHDRESVTAAPASGAYQQIRLVYTTRSPRAAFFRSSPQVVATNVPSPVSSPNPSAKPTLTSLRATLTTNHGQASTLTVDPTTLSYKYPGGGGSKVDANAVDQWFSHAGVNTNQKGVKKEAAALATYILQLQQGQHYHGLSAPFRNKRTFGGGSGGPATWYLCLLLAAALLIYALGYVPYFKIYRSRQRAWHAVTAPD